MSQSLLLQGRKLKIEFAIRANGRMPAKEFYDTDLSDSERRKLRAPMERLAEDGWVGNDERFKKVAGTRGLHEFKLHQVRIFGFFQPGGRFILTNGIRKKHDRLSLTDIEVAEQIRREHLAGEGSGRSND